MLKDMINKYSDTVEVPVSDRINVVDMLTNESAQDQLKLLFVGMTETCQELEKFEQVGEQLKNESGLVSYLASQGYEDLTLESAGEVAKEVWEKIKKAIAFLVDKFMEYFNKAKDFILNLLDNNEKKIESLLELAKNIKGGENPDLLNLEGINSKLPFKNLYNTKEYEDIISNVSETIEFIFDFKKITAGKTQTERFMNSKERIINVKGEFFTIIILDGEKSKLQIENVKVEKKYHDKVVMKKENIIKVLESLLKFNKDNKTKLNIIKNNINVLKNLNSTDNENDIFSVSNIEHNVSVLIRASKILLATVNDLTKDIMYIMANYIKCYEPDKESLHEKSSDDYEDSKDVIDMYFKEKSISKLESYVNDLIKLNQYPVLIKYGKDKLRELKKKMNQE